MDLSSLPCEFQVWFGNWIIANCDDDSERNIEFFFDKMESMPMRLCLVTVGATASFERLIRQVLNEQFFAQLAKYHYTHLLVQYGKDGEAIWNDFQVQFPRGCEKLHGIAVAGFDFRPNLWQYMRLATNDHNQELGIVISHAGRALISLIWSLLLFGLTFFIGTGTILDALRLALPLIIVPNPDLADNHQEDLAFEMEEMKYAIHADSE